jgi:hypothetical protein
VSALNTTLLVFLACTATVGAVFLIESIAVIRRKVCEVTDHLEVIRESLATISANTEKT